MAEAPREGLVYDGWATGRLIPFGLERSPRHGSGRPGRETTRPPGRHRSVLKELEAKARCPRATRIPAAQARMEGSWSDTALPSRPSARSGTPAASRPTPAGGHTLRSPERVVPAHFSPLRLTDENRSAPILPTPPRHWPNRPPLPMRFGAGPTPVPPPRGPTSWGKKGGDSRRNRGVKANASPSFRIPTRSPTRATLSLRSTTSWDAR